MLAAPARGGEIYLPPTPGEARTPETRTLTAAEETQALTRGWLFQAMGEALPQRTIKKIGWAGGSRRRFFRRGAVGKGRRPDGGR